MNAVQNIDPVVPITIPQIMRTVGTHIFVLMLFSAFLVGCADQEPQGSKGGSDSAQENADAGPEVLESGKITLEKTSMPSGRTQLPTYRTSAPDLWMTLPEGFSIRADTMLNYDIMVVSRDDDPLLKDSTKIPMGMLRITVSDSTILLDLPGKNVSEREGNLGNYLGTWRSSVYALDNGEAYYSYEMAADDYFARMSPEKDQKNLHLHMYIGGKDSAVTEQLRAAAASLSTLP